jgi:glycosyltransferase involved in cell wall biosynthesis
VLPCLDEAETLEGCIRKAQEFLLKSGVDGEIVVGDNGSTDGSQEIARRLGVRVVDVPLRGYGAALYFATRSARGRFVIMADSDGSYDLGNLMPFLGRLRQGDDLVMGNRFRGGIKPGAMPWKNRFIGNPVLSGIGRLLFHCRAKDFHSGIRGFRVDAFERMDLRTTGMEFASEMLIKATLMGMRVSEVPTTLGPAGRSRSPHLRPWRDGWRHLRFMLLYSPRWLFLYPGLLLMVLGLGVGAWLLPERRLVGNTSLDVHTLLYSALAVWVGFQSVIFAVFAKVFAASEGLLPRSPKLEHLLAVFGMEVGLALGLVLLAAGLAGSVYAAMQWESTSFGAVDPSRMLRIVIPSVTAVTLGFEFILGSFFLGVLGLRVRRLTVEPRPPA